MNYMLTMAKILLGAADRMTDTTDTDQPCGTRCTYVPMAWSWPYYF